MASQQINEVEELLKDLQKTPGFRAYLILNNEGIVLKWGQVGEESMSYETALKYSHHVLSLCDKSKVYVKDLFEPQDGQIENIRVRTESYEIIASQEGHYTLIVIQDGNKPRTHEEKEGATTTL